MTKLTFNTVAREICKREKSESREVNITDVKRVMRHFFDVCLKADLEWVVESGAAFVNISPSHLFLADEVHKRGVALTKEIRRSVQGKSDKLPKDFGEMKPLRKSKRPDRKGRKS